MRVGNYRDNYSDFDVTTVNNENIAVIRQLAPSRGWITELGVHAGGDGGNIQARLILLDDDGTVIAASPSQIWSSVLASRTFTLPEPIKRHEGQVYRVGFWIQPDYAAQFSVVKENNLRHERTTDTSDVMPSQIGGWILQGTGLGAWVQFTEDADPGRGTWRERPAGLTANSQPTFSGRFNLPEADAGLDYPTVYRLRIFDEDLGNNGRLSWANVYDVTQEDLDRGYWERTPPFIHVEGHHYHAWWDYQDSWGQWGLESERAQYTMTDGPTKPEVTRPSGKIDWLDGPQSPYVETDGAYIYAGDFTQRSPDNSDALDAIQVQVWNEAGTRKIFDSGKVDKSTVALKVYEDGKKWRLRKFHTAAFDPAKRYYVVAKAWDNSGKSSDFGAKTFFNTNAAPNKPSDPRPSMNLTTNVGNLSVEVVDPDGDDIQWVKFDLFDVTANSRPAGYPVTRVGAFKSGDRVEYDASADLIIGHQYEWEAWASDGFQVSEVMEPMEFRYDEVPTVNMIAPFPGTLHNIAENPGVEYDVGTDRNWIINRVSGGITVNPYEDGAAGGKWSWQCSREGALNPGGYLRVQYKDFDRTKPIFGAAFLRLTNGDADASVSVVAFNSSNVEVGRYVPTDINGGLDGQTPSNVWTRYGGIVPANQFPATATKVTLEVIPSETLGGVVRVDDVDLIPLESADVTQIGWLGHFDGDRGKGNGISQQYLWLDDENPGESESIGYPIQSSPEAHIQIDYSSETGALKVKDRVIIEQENKEGDFELSHDSGWIETDRENITLEPNVTQNETRARLRVEVEDDGGLQSSTSWVVFDVDFEGPPPSNVLSVGGDRTRAELQITWEESDLDPIEFVAYEVSVSDEENGLIFFKRITEQGKTEAVYPWPISNHPYLVQVRTVKAVGRGEVQSRWNGMEAAVDYSPFYFLKDISDPNIMVVFEPQKGAIPGKTSNTIIDEYQPLHQTKPRHLLSNIRYDSGSMEMLLWDDDELPLSGWEYLENMEKIDKRRPKNGKGRFCVILGHLPARKTFVVITEIEYGVDEVNDPTVSLSWSETYYEEDVYKREGK